MDSTSWDRYEPRPDDIIISTPPKVGTTWTQRITTAVSRFEFFHQGRNGQWRDVCTEEDLALYQAALRPLPADPRTWLTRSV